MNDRALAISELEAMLEEKMRPVLALSRAIAAMDNHLAPGEAEQQARAIIVTTVNKMLDIDESSYPHENVTAFPRASGERQWHGRSREAHSGVRSNSTTQTAQSHIIGMTRDTDEEFSPQEIGSALQDAGIVLNSGHLSVILSRMVEAGVLRRSGRGRYSRN